MYLWENLFGAPNADELLALPEMQYVSQGVRNSWRRRAERAAANDSDGLAAVP